MKRFFLHLIALSFGIVTAQNKPLDSVQKLDEIVLQTNVILVTNIKLKIEPDHLIIYPQRN